MTATTKHPTDDMTEAELAQYYDRTHDLSEFDLEHPEPLTPARQRLDVSISVRFTPEEIDLLRARAEQSGMKVTALIRALAVQHQGEPVVDVPAVRRALAALTEQIADLTRQVTPGGEPTRVRS